jgi:ParB-like chromosome segregation protein Spo0J
VIHPISAVEWLDPELLRANDYNPNRVFTPEMRLLKRSILEQGWTQPVVITQDGLIVDGFHRWTLALKDAAVRAASGGKVPCVRLAATTSEADRMAATVRHNRARGQHGILKMSKIVLALRDAKHPLPEIAAMLGMDDEEVARLAELEGTPQTQSKDSFGRGWIPT